MKRSLLFLLLAALLLPCSRVSAQTAGKPEQNPDGTIVGAGPATPEDRDAQAWRTLTDSLHNKKVDTRIAALSALSLLGGNSRAEDMVRAVMNDDSADVDTRVAAMVAAGQMDKDRGAHSSFRSDLRHLLGSDDPRLSFTAASTLWDLHDPAGEDVLTATAEGERAGDYTFLKRSTHNASRTLHSPEALAKIALQQSLTILVPPVGMGMGAYGYLKGSPGTSPQVRAIEQLGKVHTPAVEKALIEATRTKDAGARIAAAEALAHFRSPAVHDALYALVTDDKEQVRLTGSAAFLAVGGTRRTH